MSGALSASVTRKAVWPRSIGGGTERRSRLGQQTNQAVTDENSVVFWTAQQQAFEWLRDAVEHAVRAVAIGPHRRPLWHRIQSPSSASSRSFTAPARRAVLATHSREWSSMMFKISTSVWSASR
jgi:hypothetical protein